MSDRAFGELVDPAVARERARIVEALREAAHGGNRGKPGSFWVGWRAAARAIEQATVSPEAAGIKPSDCDECGAEGVAVPGECCDACRTAHERLAPDPNDTDGPDLQAVARRIADDAAHRFGSVPWNDLPLSKREMYVQAASIGMRAERARIVAWLRADPVEIVRIQCADLIDREFDV